MKDITGRSNLATSSSVAITYTNAIGVNVVDDNKYSTLFLCSENGQYYAGANTCVRKIL